uniref:Uncharacterized protein n=1 Tax=Ralstonia solanacearum TaxID=305 RepID=A0A0S4XA68_RALSL|nr:protein of unknown function [Ralstonia solanacearum]
MLAFFFFFKQKTAYEISLGLVGSEMCIRDSNIAMGTEIDNVVEFDTPLDLQDTLDEAEGATT